MYGPVAQRGIVFTAVGVVTSDPASVESVLAWADRLQRRVSYLIVENQADDHAHFTYWRESAEARVFRETFAAEKLDLMNQDGLIERSRFDCLGLCTG